MPGLSFICDFQRKLKQKESVILQSLNSLIHGKHYESRTLLDEEFYFLAYTGYAEYPIASFENEEFRIFLEGKIYGKEYSDIHTQLNDLARCIFPNRNDVEQRIAEWLLNVDGDFLIVILHKYSNDIVIINDALGRLPSYCYSTHGELIVSRELRFVAGLIDDTEFDTMGIAQCLLFSYPLGKRTLLKNVLRLKPATVIRISFASSEVQIRNVHQFNFEQNKLEGIDIKQSADNLAELFCEACRNRTNSSDTNIVSMSGGLDSRSVAAGLHKTNTPFSGATFSYFDKTASMDIQIAEKLANLFNIDWKVFRIDPPKGKDVVQLLRIKNGLNHLAMSFILLFFEKIKETHGSRVVYFTGDGGDKSLPDLRPHRRFRNVDQLVDYIVSANHILSLDDVAALTRIHKHDIVDELTTHILSYPEKNWTQKYVHFLIFERAFKRFFEGEDRNRFYFWSATPFYALPFFDYAMTCPDSMKTRYGLYREFLCRLSPQAAAIDNANWKLPITSNACKFYLFAKDVYSRLPSKLKIIVKRTFKKQVVSDVRDSEAVKCFWEQVETCKSISKYLAVANMKEIDEISESTFDYLFTISSAIEEFECGGNAMLKFSDAQFT